MSPASPGPVQTEASCCVKVTKALGLIFLLFFFGCSFSSPLSSPLVLDSFHLPLSLEHCLTVHLFSLCMLSLPPLFTFISRLLFFIQFPLVFFEFFSSSSLLCSSPILSTCLPIQNAAGGGCFQLDLFCHVYWSFLLPYVLQEPPFLIDLFFHLLITSQDTTSSSLL